MNWKWMVAAGFGLLLGLSIAPFGHRTVLASVAPANAHFQLQDAIVDEQSTFSGENAPAHELFLLDTETGNVWRFQGLLMSKNDKGQSQVVALPQFQKIAVESGK